MFEGLPEEVLAAAVRLGEAALADSPAPDEEALWELVERPLRPAPAAGFADGELRARFRVAIEAEFDADRTRLLAGYLCSETELALVTLAALEARRASVPS